MNASGYPTEYHDSDEEESLHLGLDNEGEDKEGVFLKRRSRFPLSYSPHARNLVLVVGMTFDDATEFKEAILRYVVAEQIAIE